MWNKDCPYSVFTHKGKIGMDKKLGEAWVIVWRIFWILDLMTFNSVVSCYWMANCQDDCRAGAWSFQHHDSLSFLVSKSWHLDSSLFFPPVSDEILGVLPSLGLSWTDASLSITSSLASSTLEDLCTLPVRFPSFGAAPCFEPFCRPLPDPFYTVLILSCISPDQDWKVVSTVSHIKMRFPFLAFGTILLSLSLLFHSITQMTIVVKPFPSISAGLITFPCSFPLLFPHLCCPSLCPPPPALL